MNPTNAQYAGKVSPKIPMRNLVVALIAATGHALFGAKKTLEVQQLGGDVVVPDGNIGNFFRERLGAFGITGITVTATKFDDAVIEVAKQVAKKSGYTGGLNAEKIERIAIEYVLTACCHAPAQIIPFTSYLATALEFRTAVKELNRGRTITTPDALEKGDKKSIETMNTTARAAWTKIAGILTTNPFFASLRMQVDVPLLFQTMGPWQKLQELDVEERGATLFALTAIARQQQMPIVDETMLAWASASVRGNLLLSVGNMFGVNATTALKAIGANKATGALANGGKKVTFNRAPTSHVLGALAGLNGALTGTVEMDDERSLSVKLDVAEGDPGTGIVIPWMTRTTPAHTTQRFAS